MNRKVILLLTALFLLVGSAFAEISSVDQLKQPGIKVGTELGCAVEQTIRKELHDAKLEQYNDKNLGYLDVANGRLDAFILKRRQM